MSGEETVEYVKEMERLYMDDLGERVFEIHFYECWESCVYLTEDELNEWFNELRELVNDDSKSVWLRMQKLVAAITDE